MAQTLVAASTYRFLLTATKDGATFDLTAATVTLTFRRTRDQVVPELVASATVLSAADGTAYYDCATIDLTDEGRWYRQWRVVQGALDLHSRQVEFVVEA